MAKFEIPRLCRGSVYLIVLALSMMVTVIGLASLFATRVQRRSAQMTKDCAEARLCARSAVELGLLYVQAPDWRNAWPNGTWLSNQPLGNGVFTLEGIDPDDGILNDSNADPLVLIGTGQKGLARQKMRVTLVPSAGLTCLEVALHAGTNLSFDLATVNCNQTISANNIVSATSSTINSDVEAVVDITGTGYNGTNTIGIEARGMPDSTVFDYYVATGTPVDYNDLPVAGIIDVVISPNSNPYGTHETNLQGIYVINCGGKNIAIQRTRIVGTLVLLNVGTSSAIMGEVNFEPAVANYPVLLVSGNMRFQIYGSNMLDETLLGINYNPFGTPYQGDEDDDTLDTYPCVIKGLVYISGNTLMQANPIFEGVVVLGGTLTTQTTPVIQLTYQSTFLNNPPPGFTGAGTAMKISPQSWKQVVD